MGTFILDMKNITFCDLTPHSLIEFRSFRWTHCLHLWDWYVNWVTTSKTEWQTESVKSTVISYITPHSLVDVHWRSRGMCCLHCQGQRVGEVRNQQEAGSNRALWHSFLLGLIAMQQLNFFFVRPLNESDDKNELSPYSLHPCPSAFSVKCLSCVCYCHTCPIFLM